MKKILLFIFIIAFIGSSAAQVTVFEGSLKEAIIKGNTEGKQVLAMLSSTTCAPCKAIVADILPLEEVGSYVNKNYIFLKYIIDEADPDDIQKTYGVSSYPTFLFLDKDGKEFTRATGGANSAKIFIDKLESAKSDPLNMLREKFVSNPAEYGDKYIESLVKVGDKRKLKEVYETLFYTYSEETFFDKYLSKVQYFFGLDSQIINYLIENFEWAEKRYGEKCTMMLKSMVSNPAWTLTLTKERSDQKQLLNELSTTIGKYPFLSSALTDFTLQNKGLILESDISSLCKILLKRSQTLNDSDKQNLLIFLTHLAKQKNYDIHKPILIDTADKLSNTLKNKINLTQLLF
ncbi:thioredoxin family protein [Sphingobacterium faecale]|uniref:Thioredoxin family protein n=1 Tax=Sphingobacterium faecale TaxID=2803775 RepID=A0ABS1R882_9SPHI|nr:thioredoxin family protein [Sphingobacterium faecale]MBL1410036.1 thioredoxin family protein [Sphingobacterium faecale]